MNESSSSMQLERAILLLQALLPFANSFPNRRAGSRWSFRRSSERVLAKKALGEVNL
jgi:hypothetical protein